MKSSRRQKVLNHFSGLLLFAFIFVNVITAFAGPGRTTYQAKIVKPDGYPLEATNVNFKFTILDPAGSCILYSETYSSVNMSSTGGLISFSLGSGVKTYPTSSTTTFEQVFSNITPSLSCDTGGPANYSPTATDIRKIVMQFHDGTGWQTLPAMNINAVPYAMYANEATKLNGLQASDFVQISTVPSCAASEALKYTGTGFTCIAVGNSVTSSTVVTALGYTPADGVSVTALSSSLTTTNTNVSSVSSTVFSVSSTVTSLQSSVAASFAAMTSSQWTTSGTNIFYNTGNIGIGTTTPVTMLDVSGGVRIGAESTTCAPALAGTLRYNASNVEYCNGTSWQAFGVSGAGLQSFNGSTSGTQSFATSAGGTAPNIVTANGVHTLNIPLASTGSVTAGLISNTDYTTFSNKITSSAASIAQVLGYVPADNAASGTYAQKANNLSDLTNIATARTNLGLGTFATANTVDLGSASATGTLAIARLPSFSGDATIAAASNTIILSNSGVTAGTYTKVTVDSKGRVTSSAALASSEVTTALGYTPANSATTVSSQWITSATNIYYNTGNVGIGTTTPVAKLDVSGGVRIGAESTTCAPALAGTLRYNAGNVEYCNGTTWSAFGVATSGLTSLNGATSQTQSFANGTVGTAPAFNTANGVHTLNIPLASTGSVTAGLISNTDYTAFTNKITSSAASIAQVLGYVPADNAASGTYAQKANNLSDLTNVATARTNLGLGTFATANTVDLGSASATGTLAIARLPSFSGDATIAAASNTIILSNSGVTAGTFTKVTVDAKGRVTSGTQLTNSDVTTALGYTPANSATIVSSQWTTSGSAIYYNSGNVGVGTAVPAAKFSVNGSALIGGSTMNYTGTASAAILVGGSQIVFDGGAASISRLQWNSGTLSFGKCQDSTCGPMSPYLDINTTTNITTFYNMNAVRAGNGYGNATAPTFSFGQTTNTGMFNPSAGTLSFATSGTEKVRITSAGTIGIGTTSPSGVFDIKGSGQAGPNMGANFNLLRLGNASALDFGEYAGGQLWMQASNRSNYATKPDLIINPDGGNIGIGTTTPTALLNLAAGTSSKASFKLTSGTLLTSPQSGTMEYDGANFYLTDSTNTRRAIAANTNPGTYDNVSNINSSSNITLTPTGSVIVSSTTASTNSSTGALIVKGGMGIAGDLNVAGTISGSAVIKATGYRANQGAPDAADSSTVGYAFGQDGDTGLFSPGSGSANGVLAFYSNNSEKMRLTSGGALGIGTATPSGKLSIGGSESADESRLTFQASDSSNRFTVETDLDGSTSNDLLGFRSTTADNILVLKGNGNIGIGTSTPSYPLDVKNQIRVGAQGGSDVSILNGGSGYGANLDLYNVSGTLTTKISANNSSYFNFGSVGIGTTGPVAKLDIKGTRQNSITTSNAIFKFGGDDVFLYGGAHNGIGGPNYPIMLQAMRDSDSVTFPLVLNPNGGNVGIGTLTPGYALSVYRGTAGVTTNNESGSAGSVAQDRYAGLTAGSVAQVYGAGLNISNGNGGYEIYDYTAGASRMFISTAGNVGIGTTSPSFKLDVNDGNARISSSNATYTALMIANTVSGNSVTYYDAINGDFVGGDYGYVGQNNSGFMEYNIGSASPMPYHVFTGGNVGIGTTSPIQKLDVVGTIRSGNSTAVLGSVLLMDAYTNGSLTNLGTEYSSGGPMLGYGVTPSNSSAAAFLSATPISLARSAMNMSDSIRFYTGAAQTVATGASVSLSEAMRITNSGNVGIGSSTPTAKFEVSRNFNGESNTTAAFIGGYDAGYTNTGAYFVQKDNTGLGSANTFLFNVVKNNTSQFVINGAGSVGIGTTSPIATLHVSGTGFVKDGGNSLIELLSRSDSAFNVTNNSTTKRGFSLHHENSSALIAQWYYCPSGSCTQKLSFDYAGNMVIAGTLTQSSDIRLKKDIVPLQSSLDKILSLNGVSYYWKDKEVPGKQIGLIAQEVEKVFPEIIRKDEKGFLSVGYQNLVAPLIESVKELYRRLVGIEQQQIEQQRQIASVVESKADKSEVEKLKAENAALKAYICSKDPKAFICQ